MTPSCTQSKDSSRIAVARPTLTGSAVFAALDGVAVSVTAGLKARVGRPEKAEQLGNAEKFESLIEPFESFEPIEKPEETVPVSG